MKLRLSIALCLGLLITGLRAEDSADSAQIVRRAREMIDATFKGDIKAVLEFTHPSVVRISGGEEPLKKGVEGVVAQMKEHKIEFVSMEVQPPGKLMASGGKTFAIVKTKTVMQIPGKTRFTESGSMIAVREVPDRAWTFLRVSAPLAENRALLKNLLPDLPDELILTAPGKPVAEAISK